MNAYREQTSSMGLAELAEVLGGRLVAEAADVRFSAVSIDSRTLAAGELFIALRGPRFDGHEFLDQAARRGACAAVVMRAQSCPLPQVVVEDSRLALGRLAAAWRRRHPVPLVAVTGSNGKTTVKEMVASILHGRGAGVVTRGNYNNDVGMPLTLLRLQQKHAFAVVEMGANRPGDIQYLTGIARPDVAVITNAAPAHLEGFGDIAGVARAKGEIFGGLSARGTAVLNHDDARIGVWRVMTEHCHRLGFGIRQPADFRASRLALREGGSRFLLQTPAGEVEVQLHLAGRHNVMNALAAAAAAYAVGASPEEIRRGLERMRPVRGRLERKPGRAGLQVIDDTYNANPGSVRAALEVLMASAGQKVLVLGDMAELGNASQALHEQVGRQARMMGVDRIYTVGEGAAIAAGAFGREARHFNDQAALIEALVEDYVTGMQQPAAATILVKGSRSMQMERVVEALTSGIVPGAVSGVGVQSLPEAFETDLGTGAAPGGEEEGR